MLGLSLRCEQRQTHSLRQTQRQVLSLEQRLEQELELKQALLNRDNRLIATRLALIKEVHGSKFTPTALCPKCTKSLSAAEIIKGFLPDPNDVTTQCTRCQTRFTPTLLSGDFRSSIETPFYCASQSLARITGDMTKLTPSELRTRDMGLYHSLIFHFGTLSSAFAQANLVYPHAEQLDWKDKVLNYLGFLPDRDIASAVGVKPAEITRFRKERKIGAYRARDWKGVD